MRWIVAPLLLLSAMGSAWVDSGHMVVSSIAEKKLSKTAKAEVERLLGLAPEANSNSILTAACWADDVRRERRNTGPWHYKDHHFRDDGKPSENKADEENAVWAIEKFSLILKDNTKPDLERQEALRFLLHYVGDIHQPLHATARDTEEHPKGDKGGNDFKVKTPENFVGSTRPPRNLHSLWDLGGGLFEDAKRPLSVASRAQVESQAHTISALFPEAKFGGAINKANPQDWADESFALAKSRVYALKEDTVPSQAYMSVAQATSAERVALAGYRLARLLNQLLDK